MRILLVAIFFTLSLSSFTVNADDDKRLSLTLIQHQSCISNEPGPYEKIRFASKAEAPLKAVPGKPGYYEISGPVKIFQAIHGTIQVYSKMQYGTNSEPEPCHHADANGCGGMGSCIFCDACSGVKNISEKTSGNVRIDAGPGKNLDCAKGLKPGVMNNVRLLIRMPTRDEFIKEHNMDAQFYNQNVKEGRTFFVTIYIFNEPVNKLSASELQRIANPKSSRCIGCHKLAASVSEMNN